MYHGLMVLQYNEYLFPKMTLKESTHTTREQIANKKTKGLL